MPCIKPKKTEVVLLFISQNNNLHTGLKPFALSLSKCERGSTSSPRTVSFYYALAIPGIFIVVENTLAAKPVDLADSSDTEQYDLIELAGKTSTILAIFVEKSKVNKILGFFSHHRT